MSHELENGLQASRFLLSAVQKVLPRARRQEITAYLQELCLPVGDWVRQMLRTVAAEYRNQAVLAFDALALGLQAAVAAYCFAAASLALPLGIALGSIIGTLILRGAHTHPFGRNGKAHPPSSPWQYSLDSLGDAVTAVVVLLFCETVMLKISLSITLPETMVLRGAFIFLPLMSTLRMVLRPRFDSKMPFQGSNLTSGQIFNKTWWLNILWVAAFIGTVIANPDSLPGWVPGHDFLHTFIPMQIFMLWFRVQQNALARRDHIETIFGDWRKKKKARQREILFKGMEKGEPFYAAHIGLQGLLLLYLTIPLATHLWPWLAGRETDVDLFRIAFNVVTLVTLAWTWNYLKDANRAASDALQQDIDSPDFGLASCA